jgi:hypothetical protein
MIFYSYYLHIDTSRTYAGEGFFDDFKAENYEKT